MFNSQSFGADNQAGYNQSWKIVELLGNLRSQFVLAKLKRDNVLSLNIIRSILDVIAGKLKEDDIKEMNELIYKVEEGFKVTEQKFTHEHNVYYKNEKERRDIVKNIEELYRKLEKLQDKYGYGMIGKDDPKFAVLKR